MKKQIKKFIYGTDTNEKFSRYFNWYTKFNSSWEISVSTDSFSNLYVSDLENLTCYFLHRNRIYFFKNGVRQRFNDLHSDYFFEDCGISDGDTVIDCGANIGEIGLNFKMRGVSVNYIAFEPSKAENEICRLNNPDGCCELLGLWNKSETLEFYEKSNTADSSLIAFPDYETVREVKVITLDEYCDSNSIGAIKVLKIEAEGAEIEALEGAKNTLKRTKFVTADCGCERGMNRESTLPSVANYLMASGFEMRKVMRTRLSCLFENTKL